MQRGEPLSRHLGDSQRRGPVAAAAGDGVDAPGDLALAQQRGGGHQLARAVEGLAVAGHDDEDVARGRTVPFGPSVDGAELILHHLAADAHPPLFAPHRARAQQVPRLRFDALVIVDRSILAALGHAPLQNALCGRSGDLPPAIVAC